MVYLALFGRLPPILMEKIEGDSQRSLKMAAHNSLKHHSTDIHWHPLASTGLHWHVAVTGGWGAPVLQPARCRLGGDQPIDR